MKIPSTLLHSPPSSPHLKAFLAFAVALGFAVQYLRITSASDPTSFFVDTKRAYSRKYSSIRIKEASDFIAAAQRVNNQPKASTNPSICVGIATVQRDDARYFDLLIGSLLDGLSASERADIFLLPFIANIDPHVHYAYTEPWLFQLADEVLTYETVPAKEKARLRSQETPQGHKRKALFDYSYNFEHCLESNAPYILMLEDDVLAANGWYRRTTAAIAEMESQPEFANSLYLRLFYNTRLQGWNSEYWPHYLLWSIVVESLLASALYILRRNNPAASRFLTPPTALIILLVCSPACIALYFAAGRLTVQPSPTGIHRMDKYGCCSQALLFPREQVPPLLSYFRERGSGLRDVLIETYADRHALAKWALTPSVFQHIGARSSKWKGNGSEVVGDDGLVATERIWNTHFEQSFD